MVVCSDTSVIYFCFAVRVIEATPRSCFIDGTRKSFNNRAPARDQVRPDDRFNLGPTNLQPAERRREVKVDYDVANTAPLCQRQQLQYATLRVVRSMAGSIAERLQSSHLIFGANRFFCPEVNTPGTGTVAVAALARREHARWHFANERLAVIDQSCR